MELLGMFVSITSSSVAFSRDSHLTSLVDLWWNFPSARISFGHLHASGNSSNELRILACSSCHPMSSDTSTIVPKCLFSQWLPPRSFKPYHHGHFGRFQGFLETPVDYHSGKWIEVVGKRGKEKRSRKFAWSVALGPSNNQVGTNLKLGRGTRSYILIGGNQVQVPSSGIASSCPGVKGTITIENSRIWNLGPRKARSSFKYGSKQEQENLYWT